MRRMPTVETMHFPVFIELEGAPCLVVGGGCVAERKIKTLAEFGARVKVVAKKVSPSIRDGGFAAEIAERAFEDGDIRGAKLVVAATGDAEADSRVALLCKAAGVMVNSVDRPEDCTFFFPAVFKDGCMTAGFSSGGKCPVAAQTMRNIFARLAPDGFFRKAERLCAMRERMKGEYPDPDARRNAYLKEFEEWRG